MTSVSIRRASPEDAERICAIWVGIVEEKDYSAVDRPFTLDEERAYIASLTPREGVFLAESDQDTVGFQSLDLWARYLFSTNHVGQLGTFVRREWRGFGIGHHLASHTFGFARANGYEKLVIMVRANNDGALRFYKSLGFVDCGRLSRQVRIAGKYYDEVVLERFL